MIGFSVLLTYYQCLSTVIGVDLIKHYVEKDDVVLFMKGTAAQPLCGFSATAVSILDAMSINYVSYNVLDNEDVRQSVKEYSSWPTIPQLYIKGEFICGSDILYAMYENGEITQLLNDKGISFQYTKQ